jgi:protein O-GlcNAc transferase
MQKNISLSILIGCFNEARYIQKCLLSLKDQDTRDFEVIISDNDSTDTTVEKILESIHGDERFHLHRQLENIGAAKNAKFLLDQVQSEFVMFLGAHDYLSKGYVRNCLAKIKQNPKISISIAPTIAIDEDGNPFESNFLRVYDFTQNEPYIRYLNSIAQIVDGTPFQGIMRTKLLKQMEIPPIASVDLIIISNMLWHGVLYYSHGENYFRRFFKNRKSSYMERITGSSDSKIDRRPFFEAYLKNFDSLFKGGASFHQQIRNKMLEILCARFRDDGGAAAEAMRPEPAFTKSPLKLVSPPRRPIRVLPQKVLFCTQNPVNYMSPPFLAQEQIVCGPFVEDHSDGGKVLGIKTPSGEYDIHLVLKRIPIEQRPDLIVVKADAARNNFPRNFSFCGIPAVLILGDTTHMKSPLEVMLRYAASEPYSLYVTDHKRHHLHWFQNMGIGPVAWKPGLFVKDFQIPFKRHRDIPLSFVGQAGKFHPWRAKMLEELERRGVKITKGSAPQKEAAAIYARSEATLNFSLNADLNLRVFEVMAAGGCLVTDQLPPQSGMDILFQPGRDFFWYEGMEDLVELLAGLRKNPKRCLEVAEAGHKLFQERHSPDLKSRDFMLTVLAGKGSGTFDLPLDARGSVCNMVDEKSFFARVSQYEWFQERHRICESLKIGFLSGAALDLACDLVDLPRHKVYASDFGNELFSKAEVAKQIHGMEAGTKLDIVVCGVADEIPPTANSVLLSGFANIAEGETERVISKMSDSGFEESKELKGLFQRRNPAHAIEVRSFLPNSATLEAAISAVHEGRLAEAEDICRALLGEDEKCAGAWALLGRMALLNSDLETAGDFAAVACELEPANTGFIRDSGEVFLRRKEMEPAEGQARRALELEPEAAENLVLLGRVLAEKGEQGNALGVFEKALRLKKDDAEAITHYAMALQKFDRGKDAISQIRKACALEPDSVEHQTNYASLLEQNKRYVDALAAYGKAARMNPDVGYIWFRQGKLLNGLKRYAEAIPILEKAVAMRGVLGEYFYEMGLALHMSKRFPEALEYYNKALATGYNTAALQCNRGVIFKDLRKGGDAIMAFHAAVKMDPSNVSYLNNLGAAALELGLNSEALGCFEEAARQNPKLPTAQNNIGNLLKDRARGMDALPHYRKAMELDPENHDTQSNYLLCHMYLSELDPKTIFEEHRQWGLAKAKKTPSVFKFKPRATGAKLRVGFLSPDLCHHPVAHFIEPLFREYDRTQFEFIAYGDQRKSDEFSERFSKQVDLWRETCSLTDQALAKQIYEDRVDILFELTGHTAYNRLPVLALKPAPLQASYLGYPGTTGLPTIGFRITDALVDPVGMTEKFHTERLVRMPLCAWCYEPDAVTPDVVPVPALKKGHITFGCFNNMAKLNPALFGMWAEILLQVPESHLRLKARTLTDEGVKKELKEYFTSKGIAEERLDFFGHTRKIHEHLNHYNEVDIALDSYPYHGTTTTCEALWMGCPVVTHSGTSHVSRVGVSLLNAVGLQEFICESAESYIAKAVELSADMERLSILRSGMRARLQASPLMDAKGFAKDFATALNEIAALR